MFYVDFMFGWSILEFLSGLVVSIFSVISIYVLYKHHQDNAPITMWLINISKTRFQFTLLIIANVLLILSFAPFFLGELLMRDSLHMAAAVIGTVSYGIAGSVLIWWTKGFMRFL